jgi:hypothetical protein
MTHIESNGEIQGEIGAQGEIEAHLEFEPEAR